MANANTQVPEDDFVFLESDLRSDLRNEQDHEPALRAVADDHMASHDAPRPLLDDLYQDVAEHEPPAQPAKASFIKKNGLYIGVGVVALALMGGLGWIAVKILSPAPVHAQRSTTPEPFGVQVNKPQVQKNSGVVEPVQFENEPVSQSHTPDQRRQETAFSSEVPGSVLPITPRTEQEQDEQFYDTLVSAAEHNTAPTPVQASSPAQAATPMQIAPETADKFAAISVAIANQSKEMSTVLEAVKSVSAEIKTLKAQVESSSSKTNLFEGKLNQLSLSLNDLTKNTESRFNDVSKAAVAAAVQAVKKESISRAGGSDKLVLVGGVMKSDYSPEKVKRAENKTPPKTMVVAAQPQVVAAPVTAKPQAQPGSGNQASKCGANTISQVWKVKGLTYSGAYVRRDDGSALMLRADMEVPGFGRVKSFDPDSRTVCTTSGLIAR